MLIYRSYKYELDPNNKQRTSLHQHAGAARFAYNWGLEQKQQAYQNKLKTPNQMELNKRFNTLKSSIPWVYEVSKCAFQMALINLDNAFKNFFEKRAKYPKFKSKKKSKPSFGLIGPGNSIRTNDKYVQLPRLGKLKLKETSNVTGRILGATITMRAEKWFVSIRVQQEIDVTENQGPSVGVDLGIKKLAVLSDGRVFENPKALKNKLSLIRRINKKFSRTKKGSKRRERIRKRLSKLHYHIACVRSDCLHKLTTFLVKNYSHIGIEDLNIKGMLKNHSLSRAISDMGWSEFRRQLEYKCLWYGSLLKVFDRFYPSSKTCSICGELREFLSLSERVFECFGCGNRICRDFNASRNLDPGFISEYNPAVRRILDVEANISVIPSKI